MSSIMQAANESKRSSSDSKEAAAATHADGASGAAAAARPEETEGSGEAELVDTPVEIFASFDDMGLSDQLLRGIYAHGFEKPSVIQQKGIVPIIKGRDIIGQAQSGTGKTGTFAIATLQRIDLSVQAPQVVVVCHTKDLAQQTCRVYNKLGEYLGSRVALAIGGTSTRDNTQHFLDTPPHVVVGTPGRIIDLLKRTVRGRPVLNGDHVRTLIIDEGDELLSEGFRDQIIEIFQNVNKDVQACLFSATMPYDMLQLCRRFMRDPVCVLIKAEKLSLEGIRQFYIKVDDPSYKFEILRDIYESLRIGQSIIYCNTKQRAEELTQQLKAADFAVSCCHGEMSNEERNRIIECFRGGTYRVLVSTDLLARGIDVQQVSVVLNYDIPKSVENYIHRIGRSGRYGRKGVAINFLGLPDMEQMGRIEKHFNIVIDALPNDISRYL